MISLCFFPVIWRFKHQEKLKNCPKNVGSVPRCFEGPTTVSAAGTGRAARRVVLSIGGADAEKYAACKFSMAMTMMRDSGTRDAE